MNPTKNDLSEKTRSAAADLMNERLADLIDLRMQTKQAHWNVKGPHFIALHELFDDAYEELGGHIDSVAERLVAIGGTAFGTIAAVSKATTLPAYPHNITSGRDHVEALSNAIAKTGKLIRAAIDQSNEIGDADTADLFTGISRSLDQRLWFVEAHLQGNS